MADLIGLRLAWKQTDKLGGPPHYDLTSSKRKLAVAAGAIEADWRELSDRMIAGRRHARELAAATAES